MHILYLSQLVPYPADAGPKVRIYHILEYLASAGHQVTLLAFHRLSDRPEHIAHLDRYCDQVHTVLMQRSRLRDIWHLARGLITGQPFLIGRDSVAEMHRTLKALLTEQSFDAIHADQLWMAQYALAARTYTSQNGRPKIVLDQHNAVYMIPKRMAAETTNPLKQALLTLESRNMARYEVEICRQFDHVIWVTAEDRQAVRNQQSEESKKRPSSDIVIPISVDPEAKNVIRRIDKPQRVTFLGGLHWPPNAEGITWFFREVWPKVRQQFPNAVFTVIGKDPPAEIITYAASAEDVEVTGYVPDPTPYLMETAVFIVPLLAGGGMRVKIIDAWSWALPIVSTTIGAEGIQYQDGENILIADSAADFGRAIGRLLGDPQMAGELATAGRRTVETCYDWHEAYKAIDTIYPRGP